MIAVGWPSACRVTFSEDIGKFRGDEKEFARASNLSEKHLSSRAADINLG